MKLSTAVQQFLLDARVSLTRSTLVAYESDLNLLVALATFHRADTVLDFDEALVRLYLRELSKKGLGMATLFRRRVTLNQFAKWGVRRRYWIANPVDESPKIKRPKRLPLPYMPDEHERLMALHLTGVDAVIRGLLAYAGLRVTEVCDLQLGNIRLSDGIRAGALRVRGKGDKERVVPVVPELDDLVRDWMLSAGDILNRKAPLIQQRSGMRWSRRMIEKRTAAWGKAANVSDCIPHRFHHSSATMMLERGANIREVQDALGHEDIATTALYLRVVNQALVDAVMRLSNRPPIGDGGKAGVTGPSPVPPGGGVLCNL
jgi:site-specific recombinase XerC